MNITFNNNDNICAISSPNGTGGVSIIRISGKDAIEITQNLFSKNIKNAKGYSVHYGSIFENKNEIDEVILTIFRSPNSFTGEDTTEINCHGSTFIQQKIIELLIQNGARIARAGEFSQRAFLNGKMDLSQTEAIADLIHANSSAAHKIAINQMKGGFSNELKQLREQLVEFASLVELELDFAEEDVEFADRNQLNNLLNKLEKHINGLKSSFKYGNAIKNGVPVAIAGKPNSGKSSLLNTLLNEQKAIVSDIPGTTRDAIEDVVIVDGIKYRFIDTAGLRKTKDIIESKGIEITKSKISEASILLYLFDISDTNEEEIINDLKEFNRQDLKIILIRNKVDLKNNSEIDLEKLLKKSSEFGIKEIIEISALDKKSVEMLINKLSKIYQLIQRSSDTVITNMRHYESLSQALISLCEVEKGLENDISGDLLSIDLRKAIDSIGEITGQITNDELLGNIFSNFCIGK